MMGMINKTDKLDARGLNRLQRTGTLPEVWIPRGELRDQRELPRTRMVLVQQRTRLKNRIHATISKHGLAVPAVSDLFGRRGRQCLQEHLHAVPPHTAYTLSQLLAGVDALDQAIRGIEQHMQAVFGTSPAIEWLRTLPGVGFILAVVIASEIGEVRRFARPQEFASYAGTTPRVHASGGKTRYGSLRPDVNRYLKWAFVEAANTSCRVRRRYPHRHVSHLYERLARPKGHQKAIGAVAASRRGDLLDVDQTGAVPRAPQHTASGLVDGGVSASWGAERIDARCNECDTPPEYLHAPRGRRDASGETRAKIERQEPPFSLFP
jgi:transposase